KTLSGLWLIFISTPISTFASSAGGGLGGGLQIVQIGEDIIGFLSGPAGIVMITLGIIAGGISIVFGRQRDQSGYRRLGSAFIGGSIIVAAASLVNFSFSGALIRATTDENIWSIFRSSMNPPLAASQRCSSSWSWLWVCSWSIFSGYL